MDHRVGQRIGNYHLVRRLGQGGFAEVYLGEHVHLGTQAAIKFLHTRLDADAIENFKAEARTIAHLDHPHIVRVHDFGVEESIPYLVMTYAPHGTLRHRHPTGTRVPLAQVASYVEQLASALQYAHAQRLIHRDVKPENLLIGDNQQLLLTDFGIALLTQNSQSAGSTDIAGTIAYMAPEQIQTHPRPASDQYSLGVMVYEWLCGERPFSGTFTEIAVKHAMVPAPPLGERAPYLSAQVEQVVMTALAKDPTQRFASVEAFARALRAAAQEVAALETVSQLDGEKISEASNVHNGERVQVLAQDSLALHYEGTVAIGDASDLQTARITPLLVDSTKPASSSGHLGQLPASVHSRKRRALSPLSLVGILVLIVVVLGGAVSGGIFLLTHSGEGTPGIGGGEKNSDFSPATHSRYYPNKTAVTAENVAKLQQTRKIELKLQSDHWFERPKIVTPAYIDGSRIYTVSDNYIQAFDLTTRKELWSQKLPSLGYNEAYQAGNVDAEDGLLFVTANQNDPALYAFSLQSGKQVWGDPFESKKYGDLPPSSISDKKSRNISFPVYANGVVYFVELERQLLFAVDVKSGTQKWQQAITKANASGNLTSYDVSDPTIANGKIYLQVANGQLKSFDMKTGTPGWETKTDEKAGTPVAVNKTIYFKTKTAVRALNADTGKVRWQIKVAGELSSDLAVTEDTVFVSVGSSSWNATQVLALNAADGTERWRSAPVPRDSDGYSGYGTSLSDPIVLKGVVFFGIRNTSNNGDSLNQDTPVRLYAFDSQTGAHLWKVTVDYKEGYTPTPLFANGSVYIRQESDIVEYHIPAQ
jgi:serine/threonine protein kinase